jgi:uncharacterized protein
MDVETLAERIEPALREAGVRFAYVFGSRATGAEGESSDLDLAVLVGASVGLLEEQRLAASVEANVGMPVDVVILDDGSLELKGHIVQEGRLVFSADEPARVAFEVRTRSEYLDFLPTLRELTRSYLERTASPDGLMVDPDRVRRLLQLLEGFTSELESLASKERDTYVREHAFAGRYLVQAAAQTCIDIANHVIASEGWRTPKDFRDAFTVLEEQEVLVPDLADRLRALAGLRNRLVHLYDEVDDGRVHEALQEGLLDLRVFEPEIAGLVD